MTINNLTNYVAYLEPNGGPRIGHLDFKTSMVTPLSFKSGTPLTNLYQVITVGEQGIKASGAQSFLLSSVKHLPPISGRDVLAVGKNYVEHAKEFNASGYDASDKSDQPTHPVIFTKRATSIIGPEEPILLHPKFTSTVDYEGEIGVIIGKPGFQISEENASDHVWGYTIVNDMTARERQRDHKQFFLGKSPDTFCPMGPVAVPKESLPENLKIQTFVNQELRQEASLSDLIFSIPTLIATISAGQTLQTGDVIATGTPAGVGFGFRPMKFLQTGDEISVSVTGLGTLTNRMATADAANTTSECAESHIPVSNQKAPANSGLTNINGKHLFYQRLGLESGPPVFFIHGLGGSSNYFYPLITKLQSTHSLHLLDLEGHGLSPTSALSTLSITSFADDFYNMSQVVGVNQGVTVIAHSMGSLVALKLALEHPSLVSKLILMGPPPNPLPEAGSQGSNARAALVRKEGMLSVVDAIVQAGTSAYVQQNKPLSICAVRSSLLSQDPEGYAKACAALAGSATDPLDIKSLRIPVSIVTGEEDKIGTPALCQKYSEATGGSHVEVLKDVGHWHLFEDVEGTVKAVLTQI
ncbi:fumarylacetoacetate hydrolase [Aspergillus flavus]|nr:fumarylacetoacetate hydrolase [Aspergillus flavus]RAQ73171.1 fumarylacetoacetate hydrolase [Aspergillus flavus]